MEKPEDSGGAQVLVWNLAAMYQEDKELVEKLWGEWGRGRAYLRVEITCNDF